MDRSHEIEEQTGRALLAPAEQLMDNLLTAFEAHLPMMLEQLADLLGKTTPRVSAREKRDFVTRLRRKFRVLRPNFAELEALSDKPESVERTELVKSALRRILIEMLAPPRIRRTADVERLDWLIAMAAKATNPPRAAWARQTKYLEARTHLYNTLMSVYGQVPLSAVQVALHAWIDGGEYRRYAHSLRLLTVAATRFRARPTQRISDPAALELQDEYTRSANLFEQQLRLLTCLVRTSPQASKPWPYWQQQNLKNLLEMASAHDELSKLVPFIDRNVRNALTHGPPIIERSAKQCQFRDRDLCVIWSWDQYFNNTRALTLAVLGCANLESFRQSIEIQILAKALSPIESLSAGPNIGGCNGNSGAIT